MHLRQPRSTYNTCVLFTKKTKKYKDGKKKETHNIIIKTSFRKFVFYMTWLMEILKI